MKIGEKEKEEILAKKLKITLNKNDITKHDSLSYLVP